MTSSGRTLQRLAPVLCILGVILVVYVNYGVILQHLSSGGPQRGDLVEGRGLLHGLELDSAVDVETMKTAEEIPKKQSQKQAQPHQPKSADKIQRASKYYAVYGCTIPPNNDYTYVFYLPLTALAWERLGFHSIVILTGSLSQWASHPVLGLILQKLAQINATVIHLQAPPTSDVMLSQVSRLFVTGFHNFTDSDYLVTSDADLWPLDKNYLLLAPGKEILSTNAHCCGDFVHRGVKYTMIPMGSVGAKVSTWRDVISLDGQTPLPSDVDGIFHYMEEQFGPIVRDAVQKGENLGWYLDQRTISMRVQQWGNKHDVDKIQDNTRNVGKDRVDRSWWSTKDMAGKLDAHLLENGYKSSQWLKLRELLLHMYGGGSPQYLWCEEYRAAFLKVLGS